MENSVVEINREYIRLIIRNMRMDDNGDWQAKMYQHLNDLPAELVESTFKSMHAHYSEFIKQRELTQLKMMDMVDRPTPTPVAETKTIEPNDLFFKIGYIYNIVIEDERLKLWVKIGLDEQSKYYCNIENKVLANLSPRDKISSLNGEKILMVMNTSLHKVHPVILFNGAQKDFIYCPRGGVGDVLRFYGRSEPKAPLKIYSAEEIQCALSKMFVCNMGDAPRRIYWNMDHKILHNLHIYNNPDSLAIKFNGEITIEN